MKQRFIKILHLSLLVLVLGIVNGCRKSTPADKIIGNSATQLRIVSLSPAISRTLKDFDLESSIVGRTPWCESIDASIPVVGDLFNLDYEILIKLDPTHVLVQPPSTGIDETLRGLAEKYGWRIGQWKLDSIDDIELMVLDLPSVVFRGEQADFSRSSSKAAQLVNDLTSALSPHGGGLYAGRTLIISDIDPVLAFGKGSFLHEILLALGGRNAINASGYPTYTLEDVVKLNPGAIVIVKPNGIAVQDPMDYLGPIAQMQIEAVSAGRLAVLSHPDAVLPSTGLIGVAEDLRQILVSFATSTP